MLDAEKAVSCADPDAEAGPRAIPAVAAPAPSSRPSPAVPARRERHYPELDGIRGLAILMVMFYHLVQATPAMLRESLPCRLLGRLCGGGWSGVDLFFVLSGFLITGILYDSRHSPRYYTSFYGRRFLRVFPLYYGVLAAIFLVWPMVGPVSAELERLRDHQAWFWLYGVNFLRVLKGSEYCNTSHLGLESFWSLAVEEHFYLIWPVVVLALRRTAAMWACVLVMVGALATRVVLASQGASYAACYMLTPCRIDSMAAGAFLALAMRGPLDLARIGRVAGVGALAAGLPLAALLVQHRGTLPVYDLVVRTVGFTILAVFFASIVALALARSGSPMAAALRTRPLGILGKYSYGIYIYHFLFRDYIVRWVPVTTLASWLGSSLLAMIVHLAGSILIATAMAWVSWNLVERHFLKAKKYFPY